MNNLLSYSYVATTFTMHFVVAGVVIETVAMVVADIL